MLRLGSCLLAPIEISDYAAASQRRQEHEGKCVKGIKHLK